MDEFILLALIAAGTVGGIFAGRLPMSGVAALGLSLVPLAGIGLLFTLC
jgi:hypothetical protein